MCVGLQDNNGFCGPSNSLNAEGIPDDAWDRVIGGDGQWAWPDPRDPNLVWTDLQTGRLVDLRPRGAAQHVRAALARAARSTTFSSTSRSTASTGIRRSRSTRSIPPTTWFGGNVVFATHDRGKHWTVISPDLTRNDKAHQQPAGGPLALDVSGAEFTGTLLDIEGSAKTRGEIWTGSDDGLVQLSRDGGKHWANVTPNGVAPDGRAEMIAPSPLVAGTAYAVIDRHLLGDDAPYVFVTHDCGAHWTADRRTASRPISRRARSVPTRATRTSSISDPRARSGSPTTTARTGRSRSSACRTTATYDIRVQPRWNDLIVATHGRALWILDDLTPLQQLPQAEAAGAMLFAPRTAYLYVPHANDEGLYTRYAGKNPPSGATIAFYQANARRESARRSTFSTRAGGCPAHSRHETRRRTRGPAGVELRRDQSRIWDLREDGPVRWNGAARKRSTRGRAPA